MQPQIPKTYQQFSKLTKQQQSQLINNRKQSLPTPIQPPGKFPQTNFFPLNSKQENKTIKLATYRYPSPKTKAVVILFHTIGCYIELYSNTAKILANNGFTVVGYDQRGHGKSQGQRGYLDDLNLMKNDAKLFIATIFKTYPNIPIFLMGHGTGGLFSFTCSQQFKQYKFNGIILLSTGFKKPTHNKFLSVIADTAFKLLPNKTGLIQPQMDKITSNPKVCQFFKNDPNIFHGKVYVGTITQILTLVQKMQQKDWKTIETPPIVLVQGQFDKISEPINAIKFYQSIQCKDKELWWYPNMWSCWIFEPEIDEINARLVKWFNARS